MSAKIPANFIAQIYRYPDESPRRRVIRGPGPIVMTSVLFMLAFLNYYGVPRGSDVFALFILGAGSIFLMVALTIIVVERSESRKKDIPKPIVEGVLSAIFDQGGISIEMLVGSKPYMSIIFIDEIKSVSGYVQGGWLWVRDRGVVIETNDNKQFRFVMSMNKIELERFLNEFLLSLSEINYPVRNIRKFQV
ncbi:hypothetical protein [Pseudomonas fluorescens]|nr:hypothetical protein [Pseudomonas fluorescens]